MRIVITGAGGFVGKTLAAAVAATLGADDVLVLTDIAAPPVPAAAQGSVSAAVCDLGEFDQVLALFSGGFDVVYHLATVPGRAAELDFVAGRRANLDGTIHVLEAIRICCLGARLVYTGSAASYGSPVPAHVDDATPLDPALSYAAHKAVGEILINDYTRRGFVDGLALRPGGILARPASSGGNASAFLNDIIHAAREKWPITLPMGPDKRSWLMSVGCLADNLIHAANLPAAHLPRKRNWSLPMLDVSMAELTAALARRYGPDVPGLVSYAPDPVVEAMFSQPPIHAATAAALGFVADPSVDAMLERCGV